MSETTPLDPDSPALCGCGHPEWQHVWNSTALPDGREPFSVARCNDPACECPDFVYAVALEKMAAPNPRPEVESCGGDDGRSNSPA